MSITSGMIFSLPCNYIPGANRKHHRCSARLPLLPPHHCLKVNPEHVNSLQPILLLFLLPLSSFTSNSPSIIPNCFWRPRLGQFLQARHFITAKNWTHGDPRLAPGSHIRSRLPFSAWEKDFFLFFLQPTVWELWLHNHHSHHDINQCQSGFSPLKLHANLGLSEPHLSIILSPALWLHWSI